MAGLTIYIDDKDLVKAQKGKETDIDLSISNMYDAMKFIDEYYKSEGFENRVKKENEALTRHGIGYNINPNSIIASDYNLHSADQLRNQYQSFNRNGQITIGIKNNPNANGTAHEIGHSSKFWNTPLNGTINKEDIKYSPYYHNDYRNTGSWKFILEPNNNAKTSHDRDLSESYSDLLELRYWLQKNRYFDNNNPNDVMTKERMYDILKNNGVIFDNNNKYKGYDSRAYQIPFSVRRFLINHEPEQIIDALNLVAENNTNELDKAQLGGPFEILNQVNRSNSNFVQRLKDPNRQTIKDWENRHRVATHKLSVGTDENGNYFVYPEVQEINGKLVDFTKPKYDKFDGQFNAVKNQDTVRFDNFEDALWFTQNYKNYYPSFDKYQNGGPTMTLDEYLAKRAAEEQEQYFLQGSRNRTKPQEVIIPMEYGVKTYLDSSLKDANYYNEKIIKNISNETGINYDTIKLALENNKIPEYFKNKYSKQIEEYNENKSTIDAINKALNENCQFAPNCIATATSNHPIKSHYVTGNQTFFANPGKYGWKEVSKGEINPGGLIQIGKIPVHAVILDNTDNNGTMFVNYAPGGHDFDLYKKNKPLTEDYFDMDMSNNRYYNFVGNSADSARWIDEYNNSNQLTENSNNRKLGGPTGLTIFIDDEQFNKGGQIHIKEKNKGKFTKQAQSAGMSVQEFARHVLAHKDRYPASTVKRANFARNASKWSK